MKTKMKTVIVALILAISLWSTMNASAQEKTSVSIEVDPITFAFNGYGVHLRLSPKNSKHMLLGVGAYAMDFPKALVDFNSENKDKGWDVRLNQGYGLFGEYHFSEVNRKWFLGGQLGIQEYKLSNLSQAGSTQYTNVLLMGYGGYTWRPFDFGLYIKPWAGIGYTAKVSGENKIGAMEYNIAPITLFATLHIGYTF